MSNTFWFVMSCAIAVMHALIGYRERDVGNVVVSLVWAFVAGLYFTRVVMFT